MFDVELSWGDRQLCPDDLLHTSSSVRALWALKETQLAFPGDVALEAYLADSGLYHDVLGTESVSEKVRGWAGALLGRIHKLFERIKSVAGRIGSETKSMDGKVTTSKVSVPKAADTSKVVGIVAAGTSVVVAIAAFLAAKKYMAPGSVTNFVSTLRGKVGALDKYVPKDLAIWRTTTKVAAKEAYGEGEYSDDSWDLSAMKVSAVVPSEAGYSSSFLDGIKSKLQAMKNALLGVTDHVTNPDSGSTGLVQDTVDSHDSSLGHIAVTIGRIMALCAWVLYHILLKGLKIILSITRKIMGNDTPVE